MIDRLSLVDNQPGISKVAVAASPFRTQHVRQIRKVKHGLQFLNGIFRVEFGKGFSPLVVGQPGISTRITFEFFKIDGHFSGTLPSFIYCFFNKYAIFRAKILTFALITF